MAHLGWKMNLYQKKLLKGLLGGTLVVNNVVLLSKLFKIFIKIIYQNSQSDIMSSYFSVQASYLFSKKTKKKNMIYFFLFPLRK